MATDGGISRVRGAFRWPPAAVKGAAEGVGSMSSGIDGGYNRVNESHYPGRIRETSLGEERADDQRHLAELEEFVKKHKLK